MTSSNKNTRRTGLTATEAKELKGKIAFQQDFKCYGCGKPLIPNNGNSHLHHLDENPKHNYIANLVVVCPLDHWFLHGFQTTADRGLAPPKKKPKKPKIKYKTLTKILEGS